MHGYPALVDRGDSVDLVVLTGEREAQASTRLGVRRLLLLNTTAPWKRVLARLSNAQKLALGNNPHGSVPALLDDCLACAVDAIVAERAPGSVRDADAFAEVLTAVRTHVATRVLTVVDEVEPVLSLAREVEQGIGSLGSPAVAALAADLRAQLASLVYPGFVADTGLDRLPQPAPLPARHAPAHRQGSRRAWPATPRARRSSTASRRRMPTCSTPWRPWTAARSPSSTRAG